MALAPSITINLPGYPFDNFPSVPTIAGLRAIASASLSTGDNYVVDGGSAEGDGGGGVFTWNDSSMAADDGSTVIRPDDTTSGQAGRWILTGANALSGDINQIKSDLAAPDGPDLIGFTHQATAADGTSLKKLQQTICPDDAPYNAVGDGVTDDTAAVNAAIADLAPGGELLLPAGKRYLVSSVSNDEGVKTKGGGQIIATRSGGIYQPTPGYAAELDPVYGRGNDFAFKNQINTAGSQLYVYLYGDSTVATSGNGGIPGGSFTPDVLLKEYFEDHWVRNTLTVTNRAVGGTNWSNANPIPDLGANTKLLIFKYSINHVSGQSVAAEISAMRAKLAAIRADANGTWDKVSIVLVGPSSTDDPSGGRTNAWYELLRGGYVQAAWDYGCLYIDLYAMFPDSRRWASYYADNPAVHPQDLMRQQMWGMIGDAIMAGGMQVSTGQRWIGVAYQSGWADFGVGNYAVGTSLGIDGKVYVRGRGVPAANTLTANAKMWQLLSPNYYPKKGVGPLTAWVYNGSAWSPFPVRIETDGFAYADASAASITAISFDGLWWSARN